MPVPGERDAVRVAEAVLGGRVDWAQRFPTGLAHYVYEVRMADGRALVARLSRPDLKRLYDGSRHWDRLPRPLGVPLPTILYADGGGAFGFPVVLMERLPGRDLGDVYGDLSRDQKAALARRVVAIQAAVGTLPRAAGYGYALAYDGPALRGGWTEVLVDHLGRSRTRLAATRVLDDRLVDRVGALIAAHDSYFSRVEPVPFLDDLTTKNVIVDGGALSGVVDVDMICRGDPLRTPALTYVALVSLGYAPDYVEFWLDELALTGEQRTAFAIYVVLDCIGLLSEQGQRFNRDRAVAFDRARVDRLLELVERQLGELGG
ncbi:MAG TPA: phosphotransferase [Dehalococcoidia bacterium]|nr:phosphotransferase [Dehalococcoidia bacterium]